MHLTQSRFTTSNDTKVVFNIQYQVWAYSMWTLYLRLVVAQKCMLRATAVLYPSRLSNMEELYSRGGISYSTSENC